MDIIIIDAGRFEVKHPSEYIGNPLYGKHALDIICDAPVALIDEMIENGENIGEGLSARQTNRMYLVGALACLDLLYRDEIDNFDEKLMDRIIKCGVNVFVKDLPMKVRAMKSLYWKARKELPND